MSSTTVIVTSAVEVFPEASLAVTVILLSPISAQVKADLESSLSFTAQLSVLPWSISSHLSAPFPSASSLMVKAVFAFSVGLMSSTTVIVTSAVEVFPEASFAVKLILLAPRSAQVKADLERSLSLIEQLSVLPSSRSSHFKLPLPSASSLMVKLVFALRVGLISSTTLMVTVAVVVFPAASFAVYVIVFAPRFAQVKVDLEMVTSVIAILSEEPLSRLAATRTAVPEAGIGSVYGFLSTKVGASVSGITRVVVS